jgi:phosphonate transport system ATP-binding protein
MLRANPGLVVQALGATLGGRKVLRGISLEVAAGEMVALIGPSGAGKTTLLRAIAGLLPAEGEIIAQGQPALVFQQHALANRLTARDNVLVGGLGRMGFWRAALRLWPCAEITLAQANLARVGLEGLGVRRADRLSGGQRQRVAIARALHQQSHILLADEPVASLDPVLAEDVLGLLQDLARRDGLAVLVSLHQHDLAARFADRLVCLEDGCLKNA